MSIFTYAPQKTTNKEKFDTIIKENRSQALLDCGSKLNHQKNFNVFVHFVGDIRKLIRVSV